LQKIERPADVKDGTDWANHVRDATHRAWDHILAPFRHASQDGYSMLCGDGKIRRIVVWNAIIANDLEEAYVLSHCRCILA
jgi:hypothetical protein